LEGIQWFEVIQQIEGCIEEMIVLKIFDVMVSVMSVDQIHSIATFLMDRGVKFGEIAHMIRSLYYENHIKSHVEAACLEDSQQSLEVLAEHKKSGLAILPECSYCGMGLNFYTYISKECKHPVSIFCAVGVTKQPEAFVCPRCPRHKKQSSLLSPDLVLRRLLDDRQRELNGETQKKGLPFDQMLRDIAKSMKQESKDHLIAKRLAASETALQTANDWKNSVYESLY